MNGEFVRFGTAHLGVLAATPLLALLLAFVARRMPHLKKAVRATLALALLVVDLGWFAVLIFHYKVGLKWALPLQLSDISILLAIFVIFTLHQRAFDVVFYWGLTAVPLAMITPNIPRAFPDPYTIVFFILHGLLVVVLLYLVWSGTLRPSRMSAVLSFVTLNGYMLLVLAANAVLGTNYMYLMQKPEQSSPLDLFGPWPYYILASEFVAAALFGLLSVPFWRKTSVKS